MSVLAVEFQSNWLDVLQSPFMRNALIGGSLVAVAAGLLGYFVITRQNAFAAHALAHIGFPGATGAILVGAPVTLGLAVFCVGGGLLIGLFGRRVADREMATGTILALATALGVLFASLASANAGTTTSVLFGNLLAISDDQLLVFAAFTAAVVLHARRARPAAGVRVGGPGGRRGARGPGAGAGARLRRPPGADHHDGGPGRRHAAAVRARGHAGRDRAAADRPPVRVAALAVAIALGSVWGGLVLSAMVDLPPSFFIVSLAVLAWLAVLVVTGRAAARRRPLVDTHHPH